MALTRGAIALAIATGAVMSAPLLMTPCGSSVPVGKRTVCTFDGTASLNSIQLMRSSSRVETTSRAGGRVAAELFKVCAAATKALAAANSRKTTDTEILISSLRFNLECWARQRRKIVARGAGGGKVSPASGDERVRGSRPTVREGAGK